MIKDLKPFEGAHLTLDIYYTSRNGAITRSKSEDFKLSKEYFYRKHIANDPDYRTIPSAPMKRGSAIDDILSGEPMRFQPKALKRDDEELWELQKADPDSVMSAGDYDTVLQIVEHAKDQPFYKWYKDHHAEFQVILEADYKGAHIAGVADIVTHVKPKGKHKIYLDDFKHTTAPLMMTAKKWYYTCLERGYFRQLGLYKEMLQLQYPDAEIICRHATLALDNRGIVRIKLYRLRESDLSFGAQQFFTTVDEMLTCEKFVDPRIGWKAIESLEPQYAD